MILAFSLFFGGTSAARSRGPSAVSCAILYISIISVCIIVADFVSEFCKFESRDFLDSLAAVTELHVSCIFQVHVFCKN